MVVRLNWWFSASGGYGDARAGRVRRWASRLPRSRRRGRRGYKRLRPRPPESAVEFMVERGRKIGPCQGAEPACGRAPEGAERRPSPGAPWRALHRVQSSAEAQPWIRQRGVRHKSALWNAPTAKHSTKLRWGLS